MGFDIHEIYNIGSQFLYPEQSNRASFWLPTSSELSTIMNYLYNDGGNIFSMIATNLFNADPQKAIINLRLYPFDVAQLTLSHGDKVVFKLMDKSVPDPLTGNDIEVDRCDRSMMGFAGLNFGHIDVPLFEDVDSFLSYDPHTKLFLYLPFAPLIPLDSKRYAGKTIYVSAHVDFYEGTLTYFIRVGEPTTDPHNPIDYTLVDCVTTKASIDIPMYSNNTNQVMKEVLINSLGGLFNMAGALANKDIGGAIDSLGKAGAKNLSVEYQTSTLQEPETTNLPNFYKPFEVYLIRYYPQTKYHLNDTDYNHLYGVPCKKIDTLNQFSGFTKVGGIHIKEIPNATTEEIREIEELLLEGVILDNTTATFDVTYDYNSNQVSLTNTQSSVIFSGTYTSVVIPETGYQVDRIIVTMGGQDISSTAVSGNTINITTIGGNINIRVVSSALPVYFTITYTGLTGATLSNLSVSILQGTSYNTNIIPDYANGYILSDYIPSVTMAGQTITIGVQSNSIYIPDVQGNIVISGSYPQVSVMDDYWTRRDILMSLPEEPIVLTNLNVTFEDGVTQYTGDDIVIDNQTDVAGYFISFTTYNNDSVGITLNGGIYVNDVYTSTLRAIEFNEPSEYYSSYTGLLKWLDEGFIL